MTDNELMRVLDGWNFWSQDLESGLPRPLYLAKFEEFFSVGQVVVVTGARRAGKSYLLRQFAKLLLSNGYAKNDVLLVNFEDPGFAGDLSASLLDRIFEVYKGRIKPAKTPFIFLDEIQNIPGWERWVRTVHELGKANLVISGSNNRLLGGELATLLTGRHLNLPVFPLSFGEFKTFKDDGSVGEYLSFGGFPKVVLEGAKMELLLSYFDDLVEGDIISRYGIRKGEKAKALGRFLLGNVGSPLSFRSIERSLGLSQETVERFVGYLEGSFLNFLVKKFSYKVKEQERAPRKVYALDSGMANVVGFRFSRDLGHLAENAVAAGLLREKYRNPEFNFYYWKDERGAEVDFLLKDGRDITGAVQVCWNFTTEKTRERELRSLVKAARLFGLPKAYIYTAEDKEEVEVDGLEVEILPLSACPYF